MNIAIKTSLFGVATLLLTATTNLFAVETLISVVNSGFEDVVLADNGSQGSTPGWPTYGGANGFSTWNPTADVYPSEAPEGNNIADIVFSSANTGCSQTLQGAAGQLRANTSYLLQVRVGNPAPAGGLPYDGYVIQLAVNDVVIAQDDNSSAPVAGSFLLTSLRYDYNAALHSSLVGGQIEIRLLTKGLGDGGGNVAFDDVRFSYESVDPVAVHGGPYRLSEGDDLTLDGSASVPSLGATSISTYEWDLDNDGNFDDATTATPTTILYSKLIDTIGNGGYAMTVGENIIGLKVTDSEGLTNIGYATVTIFPLYLYTGPNSYRATENWNQTSNWNSNLVPSGLVNVEIPSGKSVMCWDATTPEYTGDLYLGTNSGITIGWTSGIMPAYNCMGTPGKSTIHMNGGSGINMRMSGTPVIPAVNLLGNASFTLGSSTQNGAQAQFNYPITGNYTLSLHGNRIGDGTSYKDCVANFNTPNSFAGITTFDKPYVSGGVYIKGNTPGSLGTGNITIGENDKGGTYSIIEINAEDAMADTAALSIAGTGTTKIVMNADDTIAKLIINDVQLNAGTYGSTSSSASNQVSWISGDKILTVTDSPSNYWDIDGATPGAGGIDPTAPTGTWDGSANWTSSPSGSTTTSAWVSGSFASFAAGSSATGAYDVTVSAPSGITVTKQTKVTGYMHVNDPPTAVNDTIAWATEGGNAVVVVISGINTTGFTATYAGQAMTVAGVYADRNAYSGIAYIISDALPTTGNVVINMPYDQASNNTGGYGHYGYVYSILSLSGVDSAGTPVSKIQSSSTTNLTYSTTTSNAFVIGVSSDSNWRTTTKTVTGMCSEILHQGTTPAYYNTGQFYGSIPSPGSYTDIYGGSPTSLITLPLEAKTTANPLFTNQKIAGVSFEEGEVTLTSGELELQGNNPFITAGGITGIIESQLSGITGAGITKRGPGTLVLSSTLNNYDGTTTIGDGTIQTGANEVIPNLSPIYIGGSSSGITATLDLAGNNETITDLELGGATFTSGAAITTGTGTLTLSGDVDYNDTNSPKGATISGNLSLGASTNFFNIDNSYTADDDLAISAAISGAGILSKYGIGTLRLSGQRSYTGKTIVNEGELILAGSSNNTAANGGITVNNTGVLGIESLAAINGGITAKKLLIDTGGLAYFGLSLTDANIVTALSDYIDPSSTGAVAADNHATKTFNFGAASLNTYLGAMGTVTYTGTLTPNGDYRIGGGPGILILPGSPLTLSTNLKVGGAVVLTGSNNSITTTTIEPGGRLQIGDGGTTGQLAGSNIINNSVLIFNRSNVVTQGTDFVSLADGSGVVTQEGGDYLVLNASNAHSGGINLLAGGLKLGNNSALGSGQLSIYTGLLDVISSSHTFSNSVAIQGSFTFEGTNHLQFGTANHYGSNAITLGGSSDLTFSGGMINASNGDQTLTVNGSNTLFLTGYKMSTDVNAILDDESSDITIDVTNALGNVAITGEITDYSDVGGNDLRFGTLVKNGPGTLTLTADNNYTGDTVVNGGVLNLPSGIQESSFVVNNGGTLALTLGTTITAKKLTLNSGHKIKIIGSPTLDSYTVMSCSSIAAGAGVPTLDADLSPYFLVIDGNNLKLVLTDIVPPTLNDFDIVDDQNGGPILTDTLVTYTVSFSEDIDHTTVTFENAGTATVSMGTITETSPGVFTVEVTPTTAGTLRLGIPSGATITDVATTPNALDNDPVILDDTTITVSDPADPYDLWAASLFGDDDNGDGISNGLAWLLGATNPNDDARGLLPIAEIVDDKFIISFSILNSTARGTTDAYVEYSNDLDGVDKWVDNQAAVPDASGTDVPTGIIFTVQDISLDYIYVEAEIPASAALPANSIFGRLNATRP